MKELIIIGAGDFGRELTWLIQDINKKEIQYKIVGYLDDDTSKTGKVINGYPVLGNVSELKNLQEKNNISAVIAMQDGRIRKKIAEDTSWYHNWETLIHPSVIISETVQIGKGTILCANVAASVDSVIGDFCLFNIGTIIGHDCLISNYVSVMSNSTICGHVTIEEGAYLATNVSIVPGRRIGSWAKVGVGSSVISHVKEGTTVMGSPARRIKF